MIRLCPGEVREGRKQLQLFLLSKGLQKLLVSMVNPV